MRSIVEILESRIAPAALMTVDHNAATGALSLVASDDMPHAIHIYPTSATSFRIEALNETNLDDSNFFYEDYHGKLTSISYTGGNGDDYLVINNLKLTTLTFDGRDGVDTLRAADVATTGDVAIKLGAQTTGTDRPGVFFSGVAVSIGGNITTDFGAGGALVFDAITNVIKGGMTLNGGAGPDELYLGGIATSIAKGISFTGSAGEDAISVDGGTSLVVGKALDGRALYFDGGLGDDELSIFAAGAITFQGKVQFDGGPGVNKTTVRSGALTVNGDVLLTGGDDADEVDLGVRALKIAGEWRFALGRGANATEVFALTMNVAKKLAYEGGGDKDDFTLIGSTHTISAGIEMVLGDGTNTVDIRPRILKVASLLPLALPALSIAGGADGDEISVKPQLLTVTGSTLISGGNGTNILVLTPQNGTFTHDVVLAGGAGDDSIEFGSDLATLKGNLTFTLGLGTNGLDIHPDVMTVSKDLRITGAGGNDTVELNTGIFRLMGLADIHLGDGRNVLGGYMPATSIAKTLTYTGGSGEDILELGGSSLAVKGAVELKLMEGQNQVKLAAATLILSDALTVSGGDAGNLLGIESRILAVAKATTINFGSGSDGVFVQPPSIRTSTQSSFGAFNFTSTAGNDVLHIGSTRLAASGLVNVDLGAGRDSITIGATLMALKAGLTVLGGADADSVNIFGDGTITGDVNIDLAGATDEDQFLFLAGNSLLPGNLKVTGALTLTSSATNTGQDNHDLINVRDVAVTKAISLTTGAVDSAIYLNNTSTGSTLSILSGAGDDEVQIETFGSFGSMTVAKTTSILLGDGSDKLVIGDAFGDNNSVRFFGLVSVDGGAGSDTINDLSVNFFAFGVPAPVITNF